MEFQKPRAVIFDMDGTTVRHVNPRLLGVLEFLDDSLYRLQSLFRGRSSLTSPPKPMKKPPRLPVHRMIHRLRQKTVDQIVQPCPGITDLLTFLREQNIPLGIASNGLGKGYGNDILHHFHLDDYFDVTVFREDFARSKPHPDGLLTAIDRLNLELTPKDTVWYIGDRHKDIIAALSAHDMLPCHIVPFSYGMHAAMTVLEKTRKTNQIIITYMDFVEDLKKIF